MHYMVACSYGEGHIFFVVRDTGLGSREREEIYILGDGGRYYGVQHDLDIIIRNGLDNTDNANYEYDGLMHSILRQLVMNGDVEMMNYDEILHFCERYLCGLLGVETCFEC